MYCKTLYATLEVSVGNLLISLHEVKLTYFSCSPSLVSGTYCNSQKKDLPLHPPANKQNSIISPLQGYHSFSVLYYNHSTPLGLIQGNSKSSILSVPIFISTVYFAVTHFIMKFLKPCCGETGPRYPRTTKTVLRHNK